MLFNSFRVVKATSAIDNKKLPTRWESAVFFIKSRGLMLKRVRDDLKSPVKRHPTNKEIKYTKLIGESRTPLWAKSHQLEMDLTAGKVHNLRIACRELNGLLVEKGQVFSFWKQLGRTTKKKGYVVGREIREGCIIPTRGGGICQLTNALYDCALKSGFEIIERHGHTEIIPGSLAEINRDATVFWNYVDLRFRYAKTFQITAELTKTELIIRFFSNDELITQQDKASLPPIDIREVKNLGNCYSCGETDCHKNVSMLPHKVAFGKTAFLLDALIPEINKYLNKLAKDGDYLFLPLDGKKRSKDNYKWTFDKKLITREQKYITLKRSLSIRKLKPGAQLQAELFKFDQILAEKMAEAIPYDVAHVVVSQNLLPHLWKTGMLGGRTFDVVSNRLPMRLIQAQLDKAYKKHPNSNTLKDFRLEESFLKMEDQALMAANTIITNHTISRDYFGSRAQFIAPKLTPVEANNSSQRTAIVFGAPPFARKGILEFAEAIKGMDLSLYAPGKGGESTLIRSMFKELPEDWVSSTKAVFLPAYVEHNPKIVRQAIQHNIPVYISTFVGIDGGPNIHILDNIDAEHMRDIIQKRVL